MRENVLILDFGYQKNELIARRVREQNVYCEMLPYHTSIEKIKEHAPLGIVLAGGPVSVHCDNAPTIDKAIFSLGIPVLGIGYGMQLIAHTLGGVVKATDTAVICAADLSFTDNSAINSRTPDTINVWINNADLVSTLPNGFKSVAATAATKNAAICDADRKIWGLQFYPELEQTQSGTQILRNFLFEVCGASGAWSMKDYVNTAVEDIRAQVGDGKVLLALSGGVDSSVCAALLEKAIGNQLTCIFVDTGLMRKNEGDEVEAAFGNKGLNFIRVNAEKRFLDKLSGVTEPEAKRKTIGEEFIRVFEDEGKKIGKIDFLAQGTIYPDIIESGVGEGKVIKSHHNVGGLPDVIEFKGLVEPLKLLFKDEVRELGTLLGLPDYLVNRQPFPGPGLGVRCIGELTKDRLDILRDADAIFREEIAAAGLDKSINQYFAVLTSIRSVGIRNAARTYDYTVALRAICTNDFMSAEPAKIPYDVLEKVSRRIAAEVDCVNRIVYDITSKPPATIEWE